MKAKVAVVIVLAILAFSSCKSGKKPLSDQEKLKQEITEKEKELLGKEDADADIANEMIEKYVSYVDKYPKDVVNAEYLFKASEIAMNFERPEDAVSFLSRIEKNYPDFDKYATCIFLKGFVYDNYLNNVEKAREYYNLFIKKYPEHKLVKDAEAALQYLDIDDEDLIEMFSNANDTIQ